MDEDEEEARNRWAHLLNPIKDLAENWKINIAGELEDYLGELVSIKYKIGSVSGLNFTEAALLIQGAVGIYSKKVEYLFSLVTRSLAKITENKEKSKEKSSINPETGADEDVEEEEEIELLPLDDLKENADINMVEKTSNDEVDAATDLRPIDNFMLISHQKDINIEDTQQAKDNFRMNRAVMGPDGMLLLGDSADHMRLNTLQTPKPSDTVLFPKDTTPLKSNERIEELAPVNEKRNDPIGLEISLMNLPLPESSEDEDEMQSVEKEAQGLMLSQSPKIISKASQDQMDETDPWEYWDPHDDCGLATKPFKKGITYTIPQKNDRIKSAQQQNLKSATSVSILKPTYPEFQYIFDSEMKSRLERQKKSHKSALNSNQVSDTTTEREMQFTNGYDSGDDKIMNILQGNEVIEREDDSSDDIGDDDLRSRIMHDMTMLEQVNPLSSARHFEPLLNPGSDLEMSYEQLCRMHFEQSVRAAELYMQTWDSQLGAQVASWKSRLQPLLEIQESRPTYSVKSHAIELLETFPHTTKGEGIGESLPLVEIVQGQNTWEVCRSFVTMLHMINSGNVGINAKRDMREGNDKLVFTLLTRKPPTDFESYTVPLSSNTNDSKSEDELEAQELDVEEKSNKVKGAVQKNSLGFETQKNDLEKDS